MGGVVDNIDFREIEVFKYFNGFDPSYLGFDQFLPLISRRLNDYYYTKFFENKGIVELFSKTIKMPRTICKSINGELYDSKMHQITREKALELCNTSETDLIVKPSREGYGGFGIKKVCKAYLAKLDSSFFDDQPKDFIIQECIKQHSSLEFFNSTSINTFRVSSLYLNGKVSICSCMLRFGNKGSFTDNHCSGGNIIGVHEDGTLCDYAFDNNYSKFYELAGIRFSDIELEYIPMLLESVKKSHVNDFSLCKFVGFDVTVDSTGKPILIEVNASQHDIFIEQVTTGPVFNGREQEVIDYIKHKEFIYGKSVLEY